MKIEEILDSRGTHLDIFIVILKRKKHDLLL